MSNQQEKRRQQREFLYVFNSQVAPDQAVTQNENTERTNGVRRSSLNGDEVKAARQKLISELREFGC